MIVVGAWVVRKVRMGMVGGGSGAFIGAIHRMAAVLDSQIDLVCGAFSRDVENTASTAQQLGLQPTRAYRSYQALFEAEAALPREQRMEFVAIVTPNYLHFPIAKMALEYGFHVLCEKPVTTTLKEASIIARVIAESDCYFALSHTYTGYPMVKEARMRVVAGMLGTIQRVVVEYPQGWLVNKESEASKQANWRLDPERAGSSGCFADIGVHALNLAEYITGLRIEKICADLNATVEGRILDDDGSVMAKFSNGARGLLWASQVCAGEENNLNIRIYGELGSLEWHQQEPNTLLHKYIDQPTQILRAGSAYLSGLAQAFTRTPSGHPEGYIEAFANIYLQFANRIRLGNDYVFSDDLPGVEEALRGMQFIESVIAASQQDAKWYTLPQHKTLQFQKSKLSSRYETH